ncbi:MAG: hypothetical protein GEU90_07730 [Gemmatimonas sp.]|nr:hypothetical protein [Gemmatimonas sp.]
MKQLLHLFALSLVAGLMAIAGGPEQAEAHVCMDYPTSRVGSECARTSPQKIGPCGVEGRSEIINVFRPGETIELRLRETVNHPSHYRVSFNADGESFPDPEAIDDIDEENTHVVLDGIEDAEDAEQTVEITFPETECETCTLQLIQVMYDKQENGFGGRTADGGNDDIYYSCADIALRGEPVASRSDSDRRDSSLPPSALSLVAAALVIGSVRRRGKAGDRDT